MRVLTYARHLRKPYVLRTAYADLHQLMHARNSKIVKIIDLGAFYIRLTHSLRVLTLPRFQNTVLNKRCQLTPTYAHLHQITPSMMRVMVETCLRTAYACLRCPLSDGPWTQALLSSKSVVFTAIWLSMSLSTHRGSISFCVAEPGYLQMAGR